MPYTIKNYNGQTLTVVQDGTVDTVSTSLQLPGRNYAGYGAALNQSLLYLLENFANSVQPSNIVTGQLWFDTSVKKIKVYNGLSFKPLGTIEYGTSTPSGQIIGDMWFNTVTNQLFVYDGSENKLIGPELINPNAAQLVSKKLIDQGGNTYTVLQALFETDTIAILSNHEFDIQSSLTPVLGFSHIYKGINLPSRSSVPNVKLGGAAQTAESLLVGVTEVPAANFVQNTGTSQAVNTDIKIRVEPDLNANGTFNTLRGLFLGAGDNLFLGYNAGTGYIANLSGSNITFEVTNNGTTSKVMQMEPLVINPSIDSSIDLGTLTSNRWKNVYANNFYAVDNPNLAPNNAAFRGRVEGTTVRASTGFFGNITGNLKGNVVKVNDDVVLNASGDVAIFTGRHNGPHYGNVYNLNAPTESQNAVDTSGPTTIFRGSFSGVSETATSIRVSSVNYPGFIGVTGNSASLFRNTVAIRDADGALNAVSFNGVATSAQAILDENNIPRLGSVGNVPYSVVIRDSDGKIRVGDITGTASDAKKLNGQIASVTNIPSTIVSRDTGGDIFGSTFQGVAASAKYADLAEKYLADQEYEPGTVVMIGGEKEVTACTWGKRAIGVVSTNPAFMMNKELEGGTYIALKGRVPVKVVGRIKKGEELIASNNGCAVMAVPHASGVFAVALATSDDEGVKVIECLVL